MIARPFNAVGGGQSTATGALVPSLVRAALRGEPLLLEGDGDSTRAFADAEEIAAAFVDLLDSPAARGAAVNVAGRHIHSVREVAAMVQKIVGIEGRVVAGARVAPGSVGRIAHRSADLLRLSELLGWVPARPLRGRSSGPSTPRGPRRGARPRWPEETRGVARRPWGRVGFAAAFGAAVAAAVAILGIFASHRDGSWTQVPITDCAVFHGDALEMLRVLRAHGLGAFAKSLVSVNRTHTPLVPASSALLMFVVGNSRHAAEAVLPIFGWILFASTCYCVERLYTRATAVASTSPLRDLPGRVESLAHLFV